MGHGFHYKTNLGISAKNCYYFSDRQESWWNRNTYKRAWNSLPPAVPAPEEISYGALQYSIQI